MTKSDFIEKIENGNDIMFVCKEKNYTILTWTDEGIAISEQAPNDSDLSYFESAQKLVDNFLINGIPLNQMIDEIKITQYT